ncbi:hypothetical protein [Pandoraea sp. B-6]|uniref:hypothetical protein n=1 Tax=Pandoraea sp. B-6 TaxID=1204340 RepID=UPI00037B305E|nr:hypothetical protein [Pandoraea sp. B-6]
MGEQKQPVSGSGDEKTNKPTASDQKPNALANSTAVVAPARNPAAEESTAAPSVHVDVPTTKMQIATEMYKRMRTVKNVTRKDIIEKFVAEVKLTRAGASTYYQMIKGKHEPMSKK